MGHGQAENSHDPVSDDPLQVSVIFKQDCGYLGLDGRRQRLDILRIIFFGQGRVAGQVRKQDRHMASLPLPDHAGRRGIRERFAYTRPVIFHRRHPTSAITAILAAGRIGRTTGWTFYADGTAALPAKLGALIHRGLTRGAIHGNPPG